MAHNTNDVSKPVLEGVIERGPRGHFVKGNPGPPPGKGKKKGVPNKIHRTVKECMTGAAARYGRDGKGTDGMEGFWDGVAKRNPEFLAAAITKSCVPPATKEDEAGSGGGGVLSVTIISIPHDHSVCPDGHTRPNFEAKSLWEAEHARQKSEGTPLLQLEHSAVIEQEMVEVEPEPRPEPIEPVSEPVPEPVKLELVTPRYIPLPPREVS